MVSVLDLYDYGDEIFFVLEYMDQGSLRDIISYDHENYSEDFCRYSIYKVAKCLQQMHKKNFLHRDIKAANVLSNREGDVKVSDLGTTNFLSQNMAYRKTMIGTKHFMAPEIWKGIIYSKEVDVWSLGVFAYELATGKPHFTGIKDHFQLIRHILEEPTPPIPDDRWSPAFQSFIDNCLKKEPTERMTIDQLLEEHEFLNNIDVEACKAAWIRDNEDFLGRKE